ncbi:MAG: hypothetical protein EXS08_16880 [Planctomycetes bacterium]|nr:hypothetical protein [Planctomycetota bacterium]
MNAEEKLAHLVEGVRHLRRACDLESQGAWYEWRKYLTLAWLIESGAPFAAHVDSVALLGVHQAPLSPDESEALQRSIQDLGSDDLSLATATRRELAAPANLERALPLLGLQTSTENTRRREAVAALLQRYWIERAITGYWYAVELAFASDLADDFGPRNDEELRRLVSFEALEAYSRLVKARGVLGPDEERRLADLAEKRKQLEDLLVHPRSIWETPLFVSLEGCKDLDELVTPNLTVPFDLDGNGIDELWPWLAPDAGWLVWDPLGKGEITSGQQLFGTTSAWLFFSDGYRVLDALDDDRDGELRGRELAGIRVWFDRDTDGVSDRGEVVSVEDLGIVALATQSTLTLGRSPANLCGAELADGRVLPTYDWVLEPVAP